MRIVKFLCTTGLCVIFTALSTARLEAQIGSRFRRGDVNADGSVDTADPVALLGFLYTRSAAPACLDAADANDDGRLDMSDAVYTLQYLLGGGRPLRAPSPACGLDPSPDSLGCAAYEGTARQPCSESSRDTVVESLLYLTNLERSKNSLPPLKHNLLLAQAIRSHLEDMAAHDYFSHTSLDGRNLTDRIDATGYRWQSIGENIAAGYLSAETTVAGWMASPTHRANLLSPKFREIGVGHAFNASSTYDHYWGQDFGTQSTAFPVVINLEAPSTRASRVSLYVYGEGWAQDMQVSNDPSFAGASWQAFRSSVDWQLKPGPGSKTVFVKLRRGTDVRAAQDGIVLEE